tara:strand:- start:724 stop:1272 length:549 start_codon:yes stop_codon:yes gene_type:complete
MITATKNTMYHVSVLFADLMSKEFTITDAYGKTHVMSGNGIGYRHQFDNAVKRFGVCRRGRGGKIISLSRPLSSLNVDKMDTVIKDVILHELAHAFAFEIYGQRAWNHGTLWKHTARAIGADDSRCYEDGEVQGVKPKYTMTCPNGHTQGRQKLTVKMSRVSCGKCCNYFNPAYKFTITQNY